MKFNKLKTAVLASMLAVTFGVAVNNVAFADSADRENIQANYLTNQVLDKFYLNTIFSNLKASSDVNYAYLQSQDIATSVHYNHPTFKNSQMAKKILDIYLSNAQGANSLDPAKVFFTKQDVDNFEKKYTTGANPAIVASIQPAYDIYSVYAKRASEFYRAQAEYVLSLKSPINLNTNIKVPTIGNNTWRDESKVSLQQLIKNKTIEDLINLKLDKKNFTWDQLRARLIRSLLWRERLLNNYDPKSVQKNFMSSFAYALDTHSDFYASEGDFADQISKDLVGIGVTISQDVNGVVTFPSIIKDGPAAKEGHLAENDELEAISQDGQRWTNVDDLKLGQVVNLIKGKLNTQVWLKVLSKEGKQKIVTITRGRVPKSDTVAKLNTYTEDGKKFGVLKFGSFYTGADRDIRNLLKENPDLSGLIIDLRNNGGGLVDEVQGIGDIFLPTFGALFQTNDSPAQLRGSPRNLRPTRYATPNVKFDKPLMVLTNGYSASASEILASALQDYRRAIIIGNKTYGKGTVQGPSEITPYGNDGMIKLTIQKFFRVNGSSTQFKGVTPDIQLPETLSSKNSERSSINPLPYTIINPAKYTPYTNYVNSSVLRELQYDADSFIKNDANARQYVLGVQKSINLDDRKYVVLNYNDLLAQKNDVENFAIKNYNIYAQANGKPTIKTSEELQKVQRQAGEDFNMYDPYLDLTKQLLVKYAEDLKK